MKGVLEKRVRHLSANESEALLKHTGELKLEFESADVVAVEKLIDFKGSSLHITFSFEAIQNVLVTLAEVLDELSAGNEIVICISETSGVVSFDFPVESLALLRFTENKIEFHGVDFRNSEAYWPSESQGTDLLFMHCIWDVKALEALQECYFYAVYFAVRNQPEPIMRAIGGITAHLLQLEIDGPDDMQALNWAACEVQSHTYFSMLNWKTNSVGWVHALADCKGWLEIYYEWLTTAQRCVLGCLQADVVKFFDVEDDEVPWILEVMSQSQVYQVILEGNHVDARLARQIVGWAEKKAEKKSADGFNGESLVIEWCTCTRRARQILQSELSDFARVVANPGYLSITIMDPAIN